jgi:NADPH:quinone reductase-like Zn-dependent oxidoreductase
LAGKKRLVGISVGSRGMTEDMVRFIEVNNIKPVVDREFEFSDALAAYQHLEAGRAFGKVVINIH